MGIEHPIEHTILTMISLYDYLHKPAGSELGKKVYNMSTQCGVPSEIQEISNKKYHGTVRMYPKSFLDLYFGNHSNDEDPEITKFYNTRLQSRVSKLAEITGMDCGLGPENDE